MPVVSVEYTDEMKKDFIDYSMSVIVQRAIPDVRDGLKPVHRRILYSMEELGLEPTKPYRKSARVVGDCLGKFHPHGDASVYEAMVLMSQDFGMNLPLIDGQGNWGTIDGDGAAAMRYTECRLSKAATEVLADLDKNLVEFTPNFDNSTKEPTIMPNRLPSLLVNGTNGIAVGMATYIPPHNLGEVVDGILYCLNHPDASVQKLMTFVQGPDFPTGGIIINQDELLSIYKTGTGKLRVRAKIEVEDAGYGRKNLVVTEIPYSYSGNKNKILEKILELISDRKLEEITDVRDESSMEGIRMVLEVKKGTDIENLLAKLYKKTPLEDTISVNFLALVDQRPEVLNLKQLMDHYIVFQKEINTKKYQYLLQKAREKEEILQGLVKAHDVIDLIIEMLRGSKNVSMAKDCLIHGKTEGIQFKTKRSKNAAAKFNFTERQASAILDMRLQKLISLELQLLKEDLAKTLAEIDNCQKILESDQELSKVIRSYLLKIKKDYGFERRTLITHEESKVYVEETIEEDLYILIDRFNYIKAVDTSSYSRANEETLKEFKQILTMKNTDKLGIFTSQGNYYQIKGMDLPKLKMKDKGTPLDVLTKMNSNEEILYINAWKKIKEQTFFFASLYGMAKRVKGLEFDSSRSMISATKLNEGDQVVSILEDNDEYDGAVIISQKGYVLKFRKSIPLLKKNSVGVKTILLSQGDKIDRVLLVDLGILPAIKINHKEVDLKRIRLRKTNQVGIRI